MIGSLIGLELHQQSWDNGPIDPPDVPVFLFIGTKSKPRLLRAIFKHLILCIAHIDRERPIIGLLVVGISRLAYKSSRLVVQNLEPVAVVGRRGGRRLNLLNFLRLFRKFGAIG